MHDRVKLGAGGVQEVTARYRTIRRYPTGTLSGHPDGGSSDTPREVSKAS